MSKWIKLLDEALKEGIQPVPKGWQSAKQISAETKRSVTDIRKLLAKLVKEGRCERKEFRIQSRKYIVKTPHYKLK